MSGGIASNENIVGESMSAHSGFGSSLQPPAFDFSAYLTEDDMRRVAEKVYTERLTAFVDQILENRSFGEHGRITDMILMKTAESYVAKLAPNFEASFLKVCNEEINKETPPDKGSAAETFRSGIVYRLQTAAEKWIDGNRETVDELMKDTIKDTAGKMAATDFRDKIASKVNFNSILREALEDTFVNDAKKTAALVNPTYNFGQKISKQEAAEKIINTLVEMFLPKEDQVASDGKPSETVLRMRKELMNQLMPIDFVDSLTQKFIPGSISSIAGVPVMPFTLIDKFAEFGEKDLYPDGCGNIAIGHPAIQITADNIYDHRDRLPLAYHYNVQTFSNGMGVSVSVLELPGLEAAAETLDKAYESLREEIIKKMDQLTEAGKPIPQPFKSGDQLRNMLNH